MKHRKPPGRPAGAGIPREPRLPLYVRAQTTPALTDCWTVNVSGTGVGLVAGVRDASNLPPEGSAISVEFELPGTARPVKVGGTVVWVHRSPLGGDGVPRLGLGVQFSEVPADARIELQRYLADYRFHVAVAFADERERRLISAALEDATSLHFAESLTELELLLGRGDIAVVVACERDVRDIKLLADLIRVATEVRHFEEESQTHDMAARVVHFGQADPAGLVQLFNERALFGSVRTADPERLRHAVLEGCADVGVRTEQRRVIHSLQSALSRERARERSPQRLRDLAHQSVVHESEVMRQVLELVREVAPHDVGVLVQGETGTGKELIARAVHRLSDRAEAPFVAEDCGALTETLLETELFGHVRGAFTGAVSDHPGLFVLADGGTIFLDEIENTSANFQAKLLRVLDQGVVRPVGGTRPRKVNVRLVVSSNRELKKMVDEGHFRADLYYRLATFVINLPALRSRPDDIEVLVRHFLASSQEALGRTCGPPTERALRCLRRYPWPGNVRELKNAIDRAVLVAPPGAPLTDDLLPQSIREGAGPEAAAPVGSLKAQVESAEREAIAAALCRNEGVLRRAARELGVSAPTLGRKVRRLGLEDQAKGLQA